MLAKPKLDRLLQQSVLQIRQLKLLKHYWKYFLTSFGLILTNIWSSKGNSKSLVQNMLISLLLFIVVSSKYILLSVFLQQFLVNMLQLLIINFNNNLCTYLINGSGQQCKWGLQMKLVVFNLSACLFLRVWYDLCVCEYVKQKSVVLSYIHWDEFLSMLSDSAESFDYFRNQLIDDNNRL